MRGAGADRLGEDVVDPDMASSGSMHLVCDACGRVLPADRSPGRCSCGGLPELVFALPESIDPTVYDRRRDGLDPLDRSGVWRYREFLPPLPPDQIVTRPEGNTNLYSAAALSTWTGCPHLLLKHEGENPTGSFKDRGMTVATSHARAVGARVVACASTGNTSASVAAYAAMAGLPAVVFLPEGKISAAKLGQAIAYGARIVQVRGDFDSAMRLVQEASQELGLYLLNSINPFRLAGQKTIVIELLHQLCWEPPDWIVLPGGNLGNTAAFGMAIVELEAAGLIRRRPRLAVIQAEGASPFYRAYRNGFASFSPEPAETVASAIRIGNPVSYDRARRSILETDGVVEIVTDDEILEAKARVDRSGIGCEPASAASVAGVRKLVRSGVIMPGQRVVALLTGHLLKDPDTVMTYHLGPEAGHRPMTNRPITIEPTVAALRGVLSDVA